MRRTCFTGRPRLLGPALRNPNAEKRGDVHYWDVWHGMKPFTDYEKFYFRFFAQNSDLNRSPDAKP